MSFVFQPTTSTADGVVGDGQDGLGLNGTPDFLMTGPFVLFTSLQSPTATTPHAQEDGRGVVEFDTSPLVGRSDLGHSILSLTEYATEPDSFSLYAYEGNGVVDLTDFSQTNNLVGS